MMAKEHKLDLQIWSLNHYISYTALTSGQARNSYLGGRRGIKGRGRGSRPRGALSRYYNTCVFVYRRFLGFKVDI